MPTQKTPLLSEIHLIGDLFLLNVAFLLLHSVYHGNSPFQNDDHLLKQLLVLNLFWVLSTFALKIYHIYRVMRVGSIVIKLLKAFLVHVFLIFTFYMVFNQKFNSIPFFIFRYAVFVALILLWRISFIYFIKYKRAQGYNFRRVIVIGAGEIGSNIADFFRHHPEHGYKFLGFFDDKIKNNKVLGELKDMEEFALNNNVDEIYCALPDVQSDKVQQLLSFADQNLIRLKLLPDFRSFHNKQVEITFYDSTPVLTFRKEPLDNLMNRALKRGFDFAFSLFVIVFIFSWLFPIISLAILLSSKGPVFFKQLRSGRGNHAFVCYKFRTMRTNLQADELQASKNDPRITLVGKFLRSTSLDELPQFFNVLKGNMSIVGPRPHMLSHTEKYSKEIDKFMLRQFVKSGITGLAQVKGCRGETTNPALMDKRVRWDLWYIENWSFFFDMKIILLTVLGLVRGKLKGG
ncbi:MAG: undecaprenyl-phosphate glucose phosphotransferase [Bacteroidota bacterium]|nr:undecaprenyl-phosphate glucose phosphotransferase [Bacteroidota bacterium]